MVDGSKVDADQKMGVIALCKTEILGLYSLDSTWIVVVLKHFSRAGSWTREINPDGDRFGSHVNASEGLGNTSREGRITA